MKIVAIDFDGVLHEYKTPWTTKSEIHDGMVPGAAKFLLDISEKYKVAIFTTRMHGEDPFEIEMVRLSLWNWLCENMVRQLGIEYEEKIINFMDRVAFTANKVRAIIYIDDRGYRFEGTFPAVEEIEELETTWNKKRIST